MDGPTKELQEKVGRKFDPDVIVECNVIYRQAGVCLCFDGKLRACAKVLDCFCTPRRLGGDYLHYYRMRHWSMPKMAKNLGLFAARG